MKHFWICWVEGSTISAFRPHDTFDSAQKESERLAKLKENEGKKVYVFEYLGHSSVNTVRWESAQVDDLPF